MELKPEVLDKLLKGVKTQEDLAGPDGLLKQITKALVERMLAGELTHHLGYEKHDEASLSWDQLGSTRMVTDSGANVVPCGRHDYLPFGYEVPAGLGARTDGIWPGSGTDSLTAKYTGAERDKETGFDFMQARYHASVEGRLLSPDPGNAGAMIGNPQSWN
jgi:RHS repeat-associated protein